MAISITHTKVSSVPDGGNTALVQPSDWNATHSITGTYVETVSSGTGTTIGGTSSNPTINIGQAVGTTSNVTFNNLTANGNVGIGTATPSYKLQVVGSFAATTKSFVINHPTKPGMKLRYGSLEGPENGVYIRGRSTSNTVDLPDYWTKLVDPNSISVQLTPVGKYQKLYVEDIRDNKVYISNSSIFNNIDYFYYIVAERCDVEKLEVEI